MNRDELTELHFITDMANLESIAKLGILSFERAAKIEGHASIAMAEVQERRVRKRVPGGLRLHQYANLYINPRNPMMFKRQEKHAELGVVSVSTRILDIDSVVISDGNAASDYSRFGDAIDGLANVSRTLTMARWWTDADYYTYLMKKRAMCAEVLVPGRVPPEYIRGVYVSGEEGLKRCSGLDHGFKLKINADYFFQA